MNKPKVLFLCTGNSCRSQMAEGWLQQLAGHRFASLSAGMEPAAEVHPLAIKVMAEAGVDISGQQPKDVQQFLGTEHISYVMVVCDKAQQSCPRLWPGLPEGHRFYWPFDDPAAAQGSEEQQLQVFRRVRDEIRQALADWLASPAAG